MTTTTDWFADTRTVGSLTWHRQGGPNDPHNSARVWIADGAHYGDYRIDDHTDEWGTAHLTVLTNTAPPESRTHSSLRSAMLDADCIDRAAAPSNTCTAVGCLNDRDDEDDGACDSCGVVATFVEDTGSECLHLCDACADDATDPTVALLHLQASLLAAAELVGELLDLGCTDPELLARASGLAFQVRLDMSNAEFWLAELVQSLSD
jgi:hypothetical protein